MSVVQPTGPCTYTKDEWRCVLPAEHAYRPDGGHHRLVPPRLPDRSGSLECRVYTRPLDRGISIESGERTGGYMDEWLTDLIGGPYFYADVAVSIQVTNIRHQNEEGL